MSKYFEYFNLFSRSPTLRVNARDKPSSIFGSIIGFLAISILIGAISFILNEYFSRLNYTINSYTDNLTKPNINLKDFKLGFKLINSAAKEIPDIDRLFKISAIYWDIHNPEFGDNTTGIMTRPIKIPIIKCDQYKNDSLFFDDFTNYAKNFKYIDCLDIPNLNLNITGAYGNLGQ